MFIIVKKHKKISLNSKELNKNMELYSYMAHMIASANDL